jgi:hypothetical protein
MSVSLEKPTRYARAEYIGGSWSVFAWSPGAGKYVLALVLAVLLLVVTVAMVGGVYMAQHGMVR